MWRFALFLCFALFPLSLSAEDVLSPEPYLVSDLSRLYTAPRENWPEQTAMIDQAGSVLFLTYSSDVPLTMKVSYPFIKADGELSYNPLHTLVLYDVPAAERKELRIDLTRSPAWSPGRDSYFLQVSGEADSTVLVHEIRTKTPTIAQSIAVATRHLLIDEPVTLSSVNYLWGYRVLDVSFSVILGLVMLVVTSLFVFRFWFFVRERNFAHWKTLLLAPLLFLLLYDARFSLDLVRLSAGDALSWFSRGEYRQLGPIPAIAEFFHAEAKKVGSRMSVEVCSDGADFGQKQLRYMLYPIAVRRTEDVRSAATHIVLIDTLKKVGKGDTLDCGGGPLPVRHLASFAHGAEVFAYRDLPFW